MEQGHQARPEEVRAEEAGHELKTGRRRMQAYLVGVSLKWRHGQEREGQAAESMS
jgi:hypothetical protein